MHITMDNGATHITPATRKGEFRVATTTQTRAKWIGGAFKVWTPYLKDGVMYYILPGRQVQFMVNQTRREGGKVEGI